MKSQHPISLKFILVALVFLTCSLTSHAQVVIYRLDFKPAGDGVNFSFFEEGYLVAPILGGNASLILINHSDHGEASEYTLAEDAARLFVVQENPDKKRAVLSATAVNGATEAFYLAIGELTQTVSAGERGFEFEARVAGELKGQVQAASDESDSTEVSSDGSIGFAGSARMEGFFQRERTRRANRLNQTVATAVDDLVEFLERGGVVEEGSAEAAAAVDAATGNQNTGLGTPATTSDSP